MKRRLMSLLGLGLLALTGCTSEPGKAVPAEVTEKDRQEYKNSQNQVHDLEAQHRGGKGNRQFNSTQQSVENLESRHRNGKH